MTATVDSEHSAPDPEGEGVRGEIVDYVAAVRTRLADLDSDEIDELTDDLASHLTEIRAESDEPFDEIIGTPEQFASELRQSAGLGQMSAEGAGRGRLSRAVERIGRTGRRWFAPVLNHRWTAATLDFGPELRPAWWVARGYLLTGLVALVSGGELATFLFVPSIAGSTIAGFALMVALVVASIRFGRRNHEARWARWLAVITAVLAGWVAVVLFDEVSGATSRYDTYAEPVMVVDGPFFGELLPANIYAVLPDGTPIDQVLLYDESGEPITLPDTGYSPGLDSDYEAEPAVDETGRSIDNLFPRRLLVPDWSRRTGGLEYQDVPPPTIEFGVPVTPSDGRATPDALPD